MRRLFGYLVLAHMVLAAIFLIAGDLGAATGALIVGGVLWVIGGCRNPFRAVRSRQPRTPGQATVANQRGSGPKGGVASMFGRLDPAWRSWLSRDGE